MSEVKPPALFCTYRSVSPQGRIQWWKGQALMVWHSCMLMSESPVLFSLLPCSILYTNLYTLPALPHLQSISQPDGDTWALTHITCHFRTGCSAVWQVAELPLNFPDASQDSQAENEVLLSSLGLLCRSALWPLAGCKCRDTSAGRLAASWSDGALVKTLSQPCLWWQSWACAFATPPLRWLAEPVKYMVEPNVPSFTVAALKHESLHSRG